MKTLTFCLLTIATASAQTKIAGTGRCGAPDIQQVAQVGDSGDHSLVLVHQKCTWTMPIEMEGQKSTTYEVTIMSDARGSKSQDRGYVVVMMDNGDKAFVRVQGTATSKDGKPVTDEGTWSYTGGTGKLKGLTGKGTYKGMAAGGVFEDHIEGDYSIAAPKGKK